MNNPHLYFSCFPVRSFIYFRILRKHTVNMNLNTVISQENTPPFSSLFQFNIILSLLSNYGLRVSEALRIKKSDLLGNFRIRIIISKTREEKIIRDEKIYNDLDLYYKTNNTTEFFVNYKLFYRFIKNNLPGIQSKGKNKNFSVTHAFRKKYAEDLKSLNASENLIKNSLNHNSVNSQYYYISKPKQERKIQK